MSKQNGSNPGSQSDANPKSKSSLRRSLGRTMAMLLTAAMIIGTGLFAALGETAEKAGSGLLLAMILSGLIALATGLSAASIGMNIPKEGGGFIWSRELGHPSLGFVAGCAYLGKGIVSTVVISLAFALYTAQMFQGLPPIAVHILAAVAILAVTAVNYRGVELNAKVLVGTLLVQLALLGIYVAFSVPAVKAENLTAPLGNGILGILAGAAIFFWSWDGFMRMAIMAEEVKDPERTIPFAIVGGIAFAAVVFLVVAAATLGVLGPGGFKAGDAPSDTPLLLSAMRTAAPWGIWVVLAAAWLDTLTEAQGDMLAVTRVALVMGKEHELPAWLGAVHKRFKSPHHAVLALGLLCAALALFVNLRQVLEVANVFTLVWYSIVHWDSLQLPSDKRWVWPVVSWLGLAGCLALFVSLPVWALAAGALILALSFGIRWLASRTGARLRRA
jgi:APA family basic amino acid/polyamine antiporter